MKTRFLLLSVLLLLVGVIGVAYDPTLAGWITLGLVVGLVAASAAGSLLFRRRAAARVLRASEPAAL